MKKTVLREVFRTLTSSPVLLHWEDFYEANYKKDEDFDEEVKKAIQGPDMG